MNKSSNTQLKNLSVKTEINEFFPDKKKIIQDLSTYNDNLKWLESNRDSLRTKYEGHFVVVYNNKVCIHSKNLETLVKKSNKKYPNDSVLIDYVGKRNQTFLFAIC